ncbi:hypothetical protein B0H14DRAFT_2835458, partial [Mycena olivaceomarginata]
HGPLRPSPMSILSTVLCLLRYYSAISIPVWVVPSQFRGCMTGSLPLLFSEPLVVRVSSPRLSLSIVIFDSVHEPGTVYFASGPIAT